MSKDDAKRLGKFVEDYVNTQLPKKLVDNLDRTDVIHHSPLEAAKGFINHSPYDMILYVHYLNDNDVRMNVVLGLVFKDKRDEREEVTG